MGKVQANFGNGYSGAVSRSIDDIIISIRNDSSADIPFGAPVFLVSGGYGAVPFDLSTPQDFTTFLGFAVRVADKTPDEYPSGQFGTPPQGVWHPGDVMEVLVRGSIAVAGVTTGVRGGNVYIRKSDGKITTSAGASGTTVLLENVRVKHPRDYSSGSLEVVVLNRNIQ